MRYSSYGTEISIGTYIGVFIQQSILTNNWNETIARIENAILQHTYLKPELLERIPIEHIEASALLQKAVCVELIHRGDLAGAREGLSSVVKKFAAQTLRKPLLFALALLAVVMIGLRMVFPWSFFYNISQIHSNLRMDN